MEFRAEQLSAGYHKTVIVEDLTFEVHSGEILTLIGPNGAGKSTVLKTIAAQLSPLAGTVLLENESVHRMPERKLAKQLSLFLTQHIRPELMTCEDVIASGRYPYTGRLGILSPEDHLKVEEAMEMVHVSSLRNTDFTQISDGQRQRVMLARAICQEPELLVMDEPTSYLDIRHKLELLTLIRQLVRKKRLAVIMSLHELELAERISDRILCIKDGHIDKTGIPEEIFSGDYIRTLYGIEIGSFHPLFGVPELLKPEGDPEIFVIGGGGAGIPVYRRLQREGIPFAAGILHKNDVEFPVASALASVVISEKPFEPIGEDAFQKALSIMTQCSKVICCCEQFGSMNEANCKLLSSATQIVKNVP